jgi:hypothetical protein
MGPGAIIDEFAATARPGVGVISRRLMAAATDRMVKTADAKWLPIKESITMRAK